jgi:hypothetical protein
VSSINAALEGLQIYATRASPGTSNIQLVTNDLGNTGGGELSATSTIEVTTTKVLAFADTATFTDASGDLVTVRLKGGGSGEIYFASQKAATSARWFSPALRRNRSSPSALREARRPPSVASSSTAR